MKTFIGGLLALGAVAICLKYQDQRYKIKIKSKDILIEELREQIDDIKAKKDLAVKYIDIEDGVIDYLDYNEWVMIQKARQN